MPGGTGPEVAFSTEPAPSGSFTLSGVVNGSGADEVQLTADEASTGPAVVAGHVRRFEALSPPIAAVVSPTCGVAGQPACFEVNGALVNCPGRRYCYGHRYARTRGGGRHRPSRGGQRHRGICGGPAVLPPERGRNLCARACGRAGDSVGGHLYDTSHRVVRPHCHVGRERRELLPP